MKSQEPLSPLPPPLLAGGCPVVPSQRPACAEPGPCSAPAPPLQPQVASHLSPSHPWDQGGNLAAAPSCPPSLHNGPQNAWMEPHLFPGLCLCPLPPSPLPCPKVSGQTSEKPGHSLGWPPGGQPPRKPQGRAAGEGAWGRTTTLVPAATGRTSGCRASGSPSKDGSIQLAGLVPRGFTLTLSTPRMCEEIKTLVANLTNISECTVFSYSLLGSLVK